MLTVIKQMQRQNSLLNEIIMGKLLSGIDFHKDHTLSKTFITLITIKQTI